MSDQLTGGNEIFPVTQVPGTQPLAEVFMQWKKRGLEPVEVTRESVLQRIEITHDPLEGKLTWKSSGNMDGLGTVLMALEATCLMPAFVVADAAFSICDYFTRGDGQLDLGTGEAAVMVAFKDGRLALDWQPKDAPIAAKKLLASALIFMLAKDAGLPLEKLLRAFGWDEKCRPK